MHRGGLGAHRRETLRVVVGDRLRVQPTDPVGELARAGEGDLHRNLLIKGHTEQQGERLVGQELVSLRVTSQTELPHGFNLARAAAAMSLVPAQEIPR